MSEHTGRHDEAHPQQAAAEQAGSESAGHDRAGHGRILGHPSGNHTGRDGV
jgi:hypothetical protein